MRKILALSSLLGLLAVTSCAATFNITGHAPTQDNTGDCTNPVLVPTAGGNVTVKWQYAFGSNVPASQVAATPIRLTQVVAPGAAVAFSGNIASGTYTFMATCFDSLGNSSCGATITKLVRGSFADVPDLR